MSKIILKALTIFDGLEPTMSKVWLIMKNFEKHVFGLRIHVFKLFHNLVVLAKENSYSWWHMMTTDLHHVAALSSPCLLVDLSIHEDIAIKLGFLDAMRKLPKVPLNFG